jgi:hypothetical protein
VILEIAGLALLVAVAGFLIAPMLRSGRRQAAQATWPRVRGEAIEHRFRTSGNRGFAEYRVRYRLDGRAPPSFAVVPERRGFSRQDPWPRNSSPLFPGKSRPFRNGPDSLETA